MERVQQAGPSGQQEVVEVSGEVKSALEEVLREGARQMLRAAIEAEVDDYVEKHQQEKDEKGHRLVVRNGCARERRLLTPLGEMAIQAPRVNDKRWDEQGRRIRFTSRILPPYLRKTESIEELIPWLYLKGISTGDFTEALQALLGPEAPGLSATTVVRLKDKWGREYEAWGRRDLSGERYVYLWADGIYCNVRLDHDRQCFLVIIGATEDGKKRLLAVTDGFRESEKSWSDVLLDLKRRGMTEAPKLAVADGGLGFWAALPKVFPTTREQRCWVHKTANVLDKLPKSLQGKTKKMIHDIYLAETREAALKAWDRCLSFLGDKYPKAVACLEDDREALLAFYDFPAQHWVHLRTTNPIESAFATVRLRHRRTKGCGSREASLTMVFMLARQAERHWRKLNGVELIVHVIEGKPFKDGILVTENAA